MKWCSAIAREPGLEASVEAALATLRLDLDRIDLLFTFVSSAYGDAVLDLPERLGRELPDSRQIGCSASGVLASGQEIEERPALSLVAVDCADEPSTHSVSAGPEIALPDSLCRATEAEGTPVIVLADPFSCPAEQLNAAVDAQLPGSITVGGLVSGGREPGAHLLWTDSDIRRDGAVIASLPPSVSVRTVVAQGCRPIGTPLFVTRSEANLIQQLDGKAPVAVLAELFEQSDEIDRELIQHSLFVGLVMRPGESEYGPGDFLVRNILGIDQESGALGLAARIEAGAVVQFHVRDAVASATDLDLHLSRHRDVSPVGALLFSCLGRGQHLYGAPGHDSRQVFEHFGEVPIGGFFCNGEIGPVQGTTYLHSYTSSLALFSESRSVGGARLVEAKRDPGSPSQTGDRLSRNTGAERSGGG